MGGFFVPVVRRGDRAPQHKEFKFMFKENLTTSTALSFEGKTQSIKQWAGQLGTKSPTLLYRLRQHWPIDRVLNAGRASRPKPETPDEELVSGPTRLRINGVESHAPGHAFECRCNLCLDEVRKIERFVAACNAENRLSQLPAALEAKLTRKIVSQLHLAGLEVSNG